MQVTQKIRYMLGTGTLLGLHYKSHLLRTSSPLFSARVQGPLKPQRLYTWHSRDNLKTQGIICIHEQAESMAAAYELPPDLEAQHLMRACTNHDEAQYEAANRQFRNMLRHTHARRARG